MPHYQYVVFTNAKEATDAEFNKWYDDVHLDEMLEVPGVIAASRSRFTPQDDTNPRHLYLAVYEIQSENIRETLGELMRRVNEGEFQMSDTLAEDVETLLYETITPRRTAK
jgi:hypothetical protein